MENVPVKDQLANGAAISIINLVNSIISEAHEKRASDIHIDPHNGHILVRFRVDGVLDSRYSLPKKILPEIISRIKIMAGLRTDEHHVPQDGRFRLEAAGAPLGGTRDSRITSSPLDVRVSTAPTFYGENAVLRLLSDKKEEFALSMLGFSQNNIAKITSAIKKPYGMILSTGPTGSGKTTLLYALLKILNTDEISIITVEDPIEYAIAGIMQIQINPHANLTFANGLRGILRQDPNVIMVGEIRDSETAQIAVNAALTGHLLLSSVHTNDAATTLPRLLDLKIESYLVASTANAVVGQRLVRKICPTCKEIKKITDAQLCSLKNIIPPEILEKTRDFYFGRGCPDCNGSGYKGRVGICEVLLPDARIREAILKKATAGEIKQIARDSGMVAMVEDGFLKAQKGITTIDEITRVLYE